MWPTIILAVLSACTASAAIIVQDAGISHDLVHIAHTLAPPHSLRRSERINGPGGLLIAVASMISCILKIASCWVQDKETSHYLVYLAYVLAVPAILRSVQHAAEKSSKKAKKE